MVTIRGRLAPEGRAVVIQALTAAAKRFISGARAEHAKDVAVSNADGAAAGRRARARRPKRPCTRYRSGAPESATRSCSRRSPGTRGCRCAWSVCARGWRVRSRGNVPALCVRCEPRGHATRRGWPDEEVGARSRTIPPGLRAGAPSSRSRLSLPRLRLPFGPRPSHPPLGERRPTTLSNLALLCRRHHRAVHERLPG